MLHEVTYNRAERIFTVSNGVGFVANLPEAYLKTSWRTSGQTPEGVANVLKEAFEATEGNKDRALQRLDLIKSEGWSDRERFVGVEPVRDANERGVGPIIAFQVVVRNLSEGANQPTPKAVRLLEEIPASQRDQIGPTVHRYAERLGVPAVFAHS